MIVFNPFFDSNEWLNNSFTEVWINTIKYVYFEKINFQNKIKY